MQGTIAAFSPPAIELFPFTRKWPLLLPKFIQMLDAFKIRLDEINKHLSVSGVCGEKDFISRLQSIIYDRLIVHTISYSIAINISLLILTRAEADLINVASLAVPHFQVDYYFTRILSSRFVFQARQTK
jgi:hypothetical protein